MRRCENKSTFGNFNNISHVSYIDIKWLYISSDQRSVYPVNTQYQNTPYQERNYPLRLISEKVDVDIGYKWNVGSGYVLIVQAIDTKATPRQVWLSLFKDGKQVDDKVSTEGEVYSYQNVFQTTVSKIYPGENTDRVILTNTKIYP